MNRLISCSLLLLFVGAGDVKQELLQPQQPGVIDPSAVANATAADALYVGALGRWKAAMDAGEGIWTESSYKFTRASTETMLGEAGLTLEAWYTDDQERFGLALAHR